MGAMTLFEGGGALVNPLKGKINLSDSLLSGGEYNRITLKQGRFRLIVKSKEVAIRSEDYLDILVVGVHPHVQRTFYAGKYDPKVKRAPDCASMDGEKPDPRIKTPQCANCQTCPQNIAGSAISEDGEDRKGRACKFSQRLVVVLPGDKNKTLYEMNISSQSLFGYGLEGERKYPLKAYVKYLRGHNADLGEIVHRVWIDTESSTSKMYFQPSRNLSDAEAQVVLSLVNSEEVKAVLDNEMDFSRETSLSDDEPFESPAPTPSVTPAAATAPTSATAQRASGRPRKDTSAQVAPAPVASPAPTPVAKPEPEVIGEDDDDDLRSIIGDFDDE